MKWSRKELLPNLFHIMFGYILFIIHVPQCAGKELSITQVTQPKLFLSITIVTCVFIRYPMIYSLGVKNKKIKNVTKKKKFKTPMQINRKFKRELCITNRYLVSFLQTNLKLKFYNLKEFNSFKQVITNMNLKSNLLGTLFYKGINYPKTLIKNKNQDFDD